MAGRLRSLLAGVDGADRGALPAGELLHPLSLLAVALLVVNDWLFKGGVLPGWLTGKLSDLAGLVFAPLLATALVDCALFAAFRLGADVDPSLRRGKLAVGIAVVGLGFTLVELAAPVTRLYLDVVGVLGRPAAATRDPSDLLALPALLLAWWIGRGEIARVPLGRLAVVRRRAAGDPVRAPALLADVRDLADDPDAVDGLARAAALDGAGPTPITRAALQAALDRVRDPASPCGRG